MVAMFPLGFRVTRGSLTDQGGMSIMFVNIVIALFIIGFVFLALYVGMTQNGGVGTDDALANLHHMHDEAAAHRLPMVR